MLTQVALIAQSFLDDAALSLPHNREAFVAPVGHAYQETAINSTTSSTTRGNINSPHPGQNTNTSGHIDTIGAHRGVVGSITVRDQRYSTLLSQGSFGKTRDEQVQYAKSLGYRLATREESLTYVHDLLAREQDQTINEAEKEALEVYRKKYVRDEDGSIDVVNRRVFASLSREWDDYDYQSFSALFVRDAVEST